MPPSSIASSRSSSSSSITTSLTPPHPAPMTTTTTTTPPPSSTTSNPTNHHLHHTSNTSNTNITNTPASLAASSMDTSSSDTSMEPMTPPPPPTRPTTTATATEQPYQDYNDTLTTPTRRTTTTSTTTTNTNTNTTNYNRYERKDVRDPPTPTRSTTTAASHTTTNPNPNQNHPTVHPSTNPQWNVSEARYHLRNAVETLSHRGLRKAASWAAEQLIGLSPPPPPPPTTITRPSTPNIPSLPIPTTVPNVPENAKDPEYRSTISDLEQYAKSILDLGEYHRAAAVLSVPSSSSSSTGTGGGGTTSSVGVGVGVGTGHCGDRLLLEPPRGDLSGYGIYIRCYAGYMAGERRKEEEILELRDPLERTSLRNAYLSQLASELYDYYRSDKLDPFGLYIYGVVLKEIQKSPTRTISSIGVGGGVSGGKNGTNKQHNGSATRNLYGETKTNTDLPQQHQHQRQHYNRYRHSTVVAATTAVTAQYILIESLKRYPCNWSAWLDLAELCTDPSVYPSIEEMLEPISSHWMYHFFCVHLFLENQANENAIMVMEQLIRGYGGGEGDGEGGVGEEGEDAAYNGGFFVRSPYLQSQLAVAHYNMSDFETAQAHFLNLSETDPNRLDQMDVYSNILYVKEDRVGLSQLAHRAVKIDKYRPETCCVVGNYYSLKSQHEKAVQYFQRALKLDRSYMSAWTLMGHEYLEMKNTAAAIEAYRRAVDINPRDYRAWYGLGQTYEIMNMLLYALFYYRKAVELRPYDARMWCAAGGCYLGLERRDDAVRSFERAVANHDEEGIATRKLAALYREDGNVERAAGCYLRHLELRFRSQANRPDPDLGGGETEAIIRSVNVDEPEADALLFLAFYYHEHGEYETASLCCGRLLDFPGPEKEQGKALLREIRARLDTRAANDRKDDLRGGGSYRGSSSSLVEGQESFEFSP